MVIISVMSIAWNFGAGDGQKADAKEERMTQEQLIEIAEKLNKWLEDTSAEYSIGKDDLQYIIKQLLIG